MGAAPDTGVRGSSPRPSHGPVPTHQINPWAGSGSFAAQAVTATAAYEPIPPATYVVTVVNGTGDGNYSAGATVNITATVPNGKVFDKWSATGVTLENPGSASTRFTMPAGAVTVTASFKDTPKGIFGTNAKWHGAWWHYILFFIGFGFIWMWF